MRAVACMTDEGFPPLAVHKIQIENWFGNRNIVRSAPPPPNRTPD